MIKTLETLAESFHAGFAGTTTTPNDPGYDEVRAVWNGTVSGRPALIAHCHTAADVSAAVNLTRTAGVPLAVRAGGHSVAGLSSSPGQRGPTTTRRPRCTAWPAPAG